MLFPAGVIQDGPPLATNKALLLLDFQNEFVDRKGKLHVPNVPGFLRRLIGLVHSFRTKGLVVWARTEHLRPRSTTSPETGSYSILLKEFVSALDTLPDSQDEDSEDKQHLQEPDEGSNTRMVTSDVHQDPEAFLAPEITMIEQRCCVPGTSGCRYPSLLDGTIDQQNDLVLVKSDYSAFADPALLLHLRTRTITHVYVCGTLSNITVYATVLDAVRHGLEVTIIEDCLGYRNEVCHVEAVRQMADAMGANGVDYQELMDDLAGLLGDVVREEEFPTKFQVSLPGLVRTSPRSQKRHVRDWISHTEQERLRDSMTLPNESDGRPSNFEDTSARYSHESIANSESSQKPIRRVNSEQSPPRKRSTSDVDEMEENRAFKSSQKPSGRRLSHEAYPTERPKRKTNKTRVRGPRTSQESYTRPTIPCARVATEVSMSTGDIPNQKGNPSNTLTTSLSTGDIAKTKDMLASSSGPIEPDPNPDSSDLDDNVPNVASWKRKHSKIQMPPLLGPSDKIGEGDCRLILDVLSPPSASNAFTALKYGVKWQKMYHRTGPVPRLVAVQGKPHLSHPTAIPIYRHPADESPELLPMDPTVSDLRVMAEKHVGHPLNHVLIQYYRNSEDNISEHSDKTLDIVRGSSIVNVSLGAQRTMTLRTKKSFALKYVTSPEGETNRTTQRVPLPHASAFILGPLTNQLWLHSIRADKRPLSQRIPSELDFQGERISLTFRHIGTYIDPTSSMIWGQGATGKTNAEATRLKEGGTTEAETEGEKMIRAMGMENHLSHDWDWERVYGRGFDVVNFETKPVASTVANAPPIIREERKREDDRGKRRDMG